VPAASIILITCFLFPQAHRGKGKIKGYVYDEEGNPLEGVRVKLFSVRTGSGFESETNEKGEWRALWIVGGSWNIDFEKPGYEQKRINIEIQEMGKNQDIEIKLKKIEGMAISDDLMAVLKEGNRLYENKQYEEAINLYQEILGEFPDSYIVHLNIGNSYFQTEKYEKAIESYSRVLEQDTGNVDAIMAIGNSYFNLGKTNEAMEWYSKIKFEEINNPVILYNVGNSLYENSRFEEALKFFRKTIEVKNDSLDARYQLALTLTALERYNEALKEFEEYLKYDSESSKASQVKEFIDYLKKKLF
jgi:tetratricopeptide (TPR) repeat protein